MFSKTNWQEPIYKKDLQNVIINGVLFGILAGILGGALDFLFAYIDVKLSIGLVIISLMVGYRVNKSYFNFHILYPVLIIPFMILGLFISHFTYSLFLNGFHNFFNVLGDGNFYLSFLISPVSELIFGIRYGSTKDIILGIVNILIYILAFVSCYLLAKGRRNN